MFGAEHGAFELIFLAAVALIVVGPKDLPVLMRKIGQITAKMRGLAAEFRASFEEMARQSELDELRKEVEALRQGQLGMAAHQTEIEREFDELHHAMSPPPQTPDLAGYADTSSYAARADVDEDQPDLPFTAAVAPAEPELPLAAPAAPRPEPQGVQA